LSSVFADAEFLIEVFISPFSLHGVSSSLS
jgi:hypothetical protein